MISGHSSERRWRAESNACLLEVAGGHLSERQLFTKALLAAPAGAQEQLCMRSDDSSRLGHTRTSTGKVRWQQHQLDLHHAPCHLRVSRTPGILLGKTMACPVACRCRSRQKQPRFELQRRPCTGARQQYAHPSFHSCAGHVPRQQLSPRHLGAHS